MYVWYCDMRHERDADTEEYEAEIRLRIRKIGRPDAAALTDAVEQLALSWTAASVDRGA